MQFWCHRFLTYDGYSMSGGHFSEWSVGVNISDDVDKVQSFLFQKIFYVFIYSSHAKFMCYVFSFGFNAIMDGNQINSRYLFPCCDLIVGPKAITDNCEP